jgi:hypothetical protein
MDTIITTDKVSSLLATIPSLLNVRPHFENIRVFHQHFKQALQSLPCPQSTLHGWKGMVMARELHALLRQTLSACPLIPGPTRSKFAASILRIPVQHPILPLLQGQNRRPLAQHLHVVRVTSCQWSTSKVPASWQSMGA